MKRTVVSLGLAMLSSSGLAVSQQPSTPAAGAHVMITGDTLKWGPPPPGLPAGAEVAVLSGDPAKAGELFTLRVKMPAGYKVPPHWHPGDEHVSVLNGQLMMGMGETFDAAQMQPMSAGSFALMPKEMRHYVLAKGPTVIQVHGIGPFGITYVNMADDPRKKPSTN